MVVRLQQQKTTPMTSYMLAENRKLKLHFVEAQTFLKYPFKPYLGKNIKAQDDKYDFALEKYNFAKIMWKIPLS